ncbi:hypothetical protein [Microbacterium kribbense]
MEPTKLETTKLETVPGVSVLLGWAPGTEAGSRIRQLAKAILAERLEIDAAFVNVQREAPVQFGHHTRLIAVVDGREVPLMVRTASFRTASVVAVFEPTRLVGLDIRARQADEAALHEIRAHSHLWGSSFWQEATDESLVVHWSRVQAVRQADPRGVSIRPEAVRLDPPFAKAWAPERKDAFHLVDLSTGAYVITLAYGTVATE